MRSTSTSLSAPDRPVCVLHHGHTGTVYQIGGGSQLAQATRDASAAKRAAVSANVSGACGLLHMCATLDLAGLCTVVVVVGWWWGGDATSRP
jgi:hypothetical protein